MAPPQAPSARTRVRRHADRGHYDRATVDAILDEGFVCHAGFVDLEGFPVVIPTAYGRKGEELYLHGAAASRLLRSLAEGIEMCCTVTQVDGIVLARSVFDHSLNYRSVVVFGRARAVTEREEKLAALEAISNQIAPGRWEVARQPNETELKATLVLALALGEASAKVRSGPPKDEEADYSLPVWAGVVPCALVYGAAVADPRLAPGIAMPEALLPGRPRSLEAALAAALDGQQRRRAQ